MLSLCMFYIFRVSEAKQSFLSFRKTLAFSLSIPAHEQVYLQSCAGMLREKEGEAFLRKREEREASEPANRITRSVIRL